MPSIFSQAAGSVAIIKTQQPPLGFRINFGQGQAGRQDTFIVTNAGIEQEEGLQILHSLEEMIHIYLFSSRASEMQVAGIAFPKVCPGNESGIKDAFDYYENNRASHRQMPVSIAFGNAAMFSGFLSRSRIEVVRPEITLGQFFFSFIVFPLRNPIAAPRRNP